MYINAPKKMCQYISQLLGIKLFLFLGMGGVTRPRPYGLGKEGIKQVRQIIAGEPFASSCVTSAIFISSQATET